MHTQSQSFFHFCSGQSEVRDWLKQDFFNGNPIFVVSFQPQTDNVNSRFQALNIDDEDESDKDKHEDDSAAKTAPKKKKDKKKKDTDDEELAKDDEDNNDASERTENQGNGVTADHDADELAVGASKKSKKKKKEKKMFDPDDELDTEEATRSIATDSNEQKSLDTEGVADETSEPLIKTAAQKRAEKKEREKKKKEAEKAKKAAKAKKEMEVKDKTGDETLEEPGSELGKPTGERWWQFGAFLHSIA